MEQMIKTIGTRKAQIPCWIDYTIVLLLIAATGFEWCFRYPEMIFFWVFPLSLILYFRRHPKLNTNNLVLFVIGYLIWSLFQFVSEQSIPSALINFFIRLMIYYLAVSSIVDLPDVIVRVIKWICIVSLIMYSLTLAPQIRELCISLFSGIRPVGGFAENELNTNPGQTMIFYFLSKGFGVSTFRNSGPFWEPGMFAVFINIALALNLIKERKFNKDTYIFLMASLSTLSTASAVATIFIVGYYLILIKREVLSIFYLLILGGVLIVFLESDFGLSKIQRDSDSAATYSRFGAIAYHLTLIEKFFYIGRGFDSHATTELLISPNGITGVFVFLGVPFGILYYILLLRGVKLLIMQYIGHIDIKDVFLITAAFLIVVFSQGATTRHFYYAIMMAGLNYRCIKSRII